MSAPLRALFIDRGLFFAGGVSKVILSLAKYMDRSAIQMHFTALKGLDPTMYEAFTAQGVRMHPALGDAFVGPAWRLRQLLREQDIRLVVCNCFRSYLVTKLATLGLPIRILYWVHGIDELSGSPLRYRLFSVLAWRDALLFISQAARRANRPTGHRGGDDTVYNGVEPPESDPKWQPYPRSQRSEFGLSQDDVVLICTGSFEKRKSQRLLVEAFCELWQTQPRLQLLLIGEGVLREAVEAYAGTLPCRDRIHFLGLRTDARSLLGLADLAVHPAYNEAFGLTVVEAMLARLPVVVANHSALPELIRHGETGLLFENGSPADLSRQLHTLVTDPALTRRLGEAAREDALRRFAPARFAEQVGRVMLRRAGRPAALAWSADGQTQ